MGTCFLVLVSTSTDTYTKMCNPPGIKQASENILFSPEVT